MGGPYLRGDSDSNPDIRRSLIGTRCKGEPDVRGGSYGDPDVKEDFDGDPGTRGHFDVTGALNVTLMLGELETRTLVGP